MKTTNTRLGSDRKDTQPPVAGRKRPRIPISAVSSSVSSSSSPVPERGIPERGPALRQPSVRMSLLRRPGNLLRELSHSQQSEATEISKESQFMAQLPLKAPYVPDDICNVCGKVECECEVETDSEDEVEEIPLSCCEKIIQAIRSKTDVVRYYSGIVVNDQGFQMFIVILIILNALLIGVATFDAVEDSPDASRAFRIVDLVFLIIFTIELIMQFLYHGYNLFFDGWLVFDLVIVVTSWTLESISVLRALKLRSFRIFRAFRLTTRIRALRRLVEAIFDVLPKITAIITMFALIMYIFAVMCTELFGEIDFHGRFVESAMDQYDYFSRLDYSLFTLFHMVTLDWAKVTRAVMQVYPWAWAIFSTFVTFSSFVLYNLIIAVVCDAVKMVQDKQDILMVENFVKDKIESRHRIINLRQKLDKMSKQQMDLLLYVQLLLEQLEDIDEASKQHYEETLLVLGQMGGSAREALQKALRQLDDLDKASKHKTPSANKEISHEATESPQKSKPRRVSFTFNNSQYYTSKLPVIPVSEARLNEEEDENDALGRFGEFAEDEPEDEASDDELQLSQRYFGAREGTEARFGNDESSENTDDINVSYHTASPDFDDEEEALGRLESSFKNDLKSVKERLNRLK